MRYAGQWEDATVWMLAAWSVGLIAYLLYVRSYFGPQATGTQSTEPPGATS
jgi:hypothetical protein